MSILDELELNPRGHFILPRAAEGGPGSGPNPGGGGKEAEKASAHAEKLGGKSDKSDEQGHISGRYTNKHINAAEAHTAAAAAHTAAGNHAQAAYHTAQAAKYTARHNDTSNDS